MEKKKRAIKDALRLTDKDLLLVKVEVVLILAITMWILTLSGN